MADLQKIQFNNRTILVPSRDSFVAFDKQPKLVYLSYLDSLSGTNDVPIINTTGGAWNLNSRIISRGTGKSGGQIPSTYRQTKYAIFGGAGTTGILPVTNLRKFTISAWMYSTTNGAGEFWGVRYHTSKAFIWFYLGDATSYLTFNFNLTTSNYTLYEGISDGNNGCTCPTSIGAKSGWAYVSLFIDRDNNRAEYWVNGHHMFDISGKANLFNGTQDFDTILRFYPDANYTGFYMCELAIWGGKCVVPPTKPLV